LVSNVVLVLIGLSAGLLLGWALLALVRRPDLLAAPNARSSHARPTPTMGGAVMVVIVLAYFVTLTNADAQLGWGWTACLAGVALIGLWDDLSDLSARVRISVHIACAVGLLVVMDLHASAPVWQFVLLAFALVWMINLYNFMDGIDGYAGVQCLLFCVGAQIVGLGVPGWSGDLMWLLAGAALAFLGFNWPPARIFMGDVSSGFLGLLLGGLALHFWQVNSVPLVASLILLAVFWFDATYTLCVRILTGQEFTQAHRQHLYQQLAGRRGHLWMTGVFIAYAAVWLVPLAVSTVTFPEYQYLALLLAVLPIAAACVRFGAGRAPAKAPS
jgi:Fuc2NAc and GlcNAc transferase